MGHFIKITNLRIKIQNTYILHTNKFGKDNAKYCLEKNKITKSFCKNIFSENKLREINCCGNYFFITIVWTIVLDFTNDPSIMYKYVKIKYFYFHICIVLNFLLIKIIRSSAYKNCL